MTLSQSPIIETGIDLKIDSAVQDMCKVSNESSSSTRSVLYLLVIISMIQLVVVLNTFPFSWHNLKAKRISSEIGRISLKIDSLKLNNKQVGYAENMSNLLNEKRSLLSAKKELDKYDMDNYNIVKLPLINISIHVNDIGFVSGFLLCILFVVLVFTLDREEINLCIALRAVTYRYTESSDKSAFKKELKALSISPEESDVLLTEINKTRRNYHYNFLTMNEIFTQPNTSISLVLNEYDDASDKWKDAILDKKYWLASIVLFLTFLNDLLTYEKGFTQYGVTRTIFHYIVMAFTLAVMIVLTRRCQKVTNRILKRYNGFRKNNYQFVNLQ